MDWTARAGIPDDTADSPILEVVDAVHHYGDVTSLSHVSMRAARGEFLTILGESGSGKTTLLKIISGLERPSQVAKLALAGVDVSHTPASKRNCTTVFQHYALFPHMSVRENVEYGLRVRGISPDERRKRAEDGLGLVRLSHKADRRIHQLSGGERQRVALARALVTQPALLLLDEPIGALDEKLRQEMQLELVQIQRKLGITFLYVTHSQEEALTMSDRIVLMRRGKIVQEGPPESLFDRPATRFVAEFMGVDNVIPAACVEVAGDKVSGRIGDGVIAGRWCGRASPKPGDEICFGIRAERVHVGSTASSASAGNENRLPATPGTRLYRGKFVDQSAVTSAGEVKARIWDRREDSREFSWVWWNFEDTVAFPNE